MKNQSKIRSIIRDIIQESQHKPLSVPKTFGGFRKSIALLVKRAGGPKEFVAELADVGYEGGGVAGSLENTWQEIEFELAELKREKASKKEYALMYAGYVHDAVLNACDEFFNSWNYEPGRRAARFDAHDLAKRAESIANGGTPSRGPLKKMKGDITTQDVLDRFIKKMKSESRSVQFTNMRTHQPAFLGVSVDVTDKKHVKTRDQIDNLIGFSTEVFREIISDMGGEIKDETPGNVYAKFYDVDTNIKKDVEATISWRHTAKIPTVSVNVSVDEPHT